MGLGLYENMLILLRLRRLTLRRAMIALIVTVECKVEVVSVSRTPKERDHDVTQTDPLNNRNLFV